MRIELRWEHIEKRPVLIYDFYQSWTWDDFSIIKQRADGLLEFSSVLIPLIFDLRRAPDMPPGMLKQTRDFAETRQLNGSPIIIIGASKVVQTTFTIVKRMIGGEDKDLIEDIIFVQEWEDVPMRLSRYPVSR